MNKIISAFCLLGLGFSFAFAQSVGGDSNGNGIRDDVDSLISVIAQQYSLQAPQLSAVAQVARSQQYILSANPQNRAQAIEIAKRDTAATNCASSRLPGTLMEIVYSRIEAATFNTVERQAAQDYYTSLLGEDDVATPVVVNACEDNYSSNTGNNGGATGNTNTTGSYGSIVPSGVVADNSINYQCTVMTQFMEYGSRAAQVLTLQKFLSDTGYMEMWPTGYFGRNTEAAVRLWQSRHGIDIRGYVGPSTRASIAAITCKGDTASISRARAGVSTTKTSTAPKVTASVNTYVQAPVTLVNSNTAQPTITTNVNTYSTAKLSSSSGTFFTRRSPVNTLYVTYRTDTSLPSTICFEKVNDNNCSNPDNFVALASQYRPGAYDAIPNGDRWMLNFYYNPTNWANGGKVYIKSTSAIADVYTINVSDTQ